MDQSRAIHHSSSRRWRLGVLASCCAALALVIVALMAASSPMWLRGGLGLAGLTLLAAGVGLLVAHVVLDERHPPSGGVRR